MIAKDAMSIYSLGLMRCGPLITRFQNSMLHVKSLRRNGPGDKGFERERERERGGGVLLTYMYMFMLAVHTCTYTHIHVHMPSSMHGSKNHLI